MIHIDRSTVPEPDQLRSAAAKAARKEASEAPAPGAKQVPFKIASLLFTDEIRWALRLLFHDKCAFCESAITVALLGDIAHYRPAGGALDSDGSYAPRHYRWLTYEWSNVYLSCPECMRFKGHRFPVDGPRVAFGASVKALAKERPLLLDPCGIE